jgi:hypothetical protein
VFSHFHGPPSLYRLQRCQEDADREQCAALREQRKGALAIKTLERRCARLGMEAEDSEKRALSATIAAAVMQKQMQALQDHSGQPAEAHSAELKVCTTSA